MTRAPKLSPATLDAIQRRHLAGESLATLAREHGVSVGSLVRRLAERHRETMWSVARESAAPAGGVVSVGEPPTRWRGKVRYRH